MSSETSGFVPVRDRIADTLRAQIRSGELEPGDPLPSLNGLAERWSVAKATAEAAIAVLRDEGLITPGGRGRPATVRQPPKRQPLALSPEWTQIQKDMVLRPASERARKGAIELTAGVLIDDTTSTAQYSRVLADRDLAGEFDVAVGTELMRREYEMTDRETGVRLSWSVSYIPLELIESNPDLLDDSNEPWPGGHQHQLFTVGIEIDRFARSVIAVQPSTSDRQRWHMDAGVPIIHVRSKSIDIQDRVVELSDAAYPADRTEITFTEQLKRWTPDQLAEVRGD